MKNQKSPKIIRTRKNNLDSLLSKLAIFVSILMIVGGTIGMILIQKDLRKSQDLRQQASVANGQVTVTMSASELKPNNLGSIEFFVNTNGVQTDGVQLTFNIVTDTLSTPPIFVLPTPSPLQLAYSEVETTADGYLVSLIAIPSQIGQSFSTSSPTSFGSLDLMPTSAGTITLNFDVENSISTVHASNPPTDELTHITTTSFTIEPDTTFTYCENNEDCQTGYVCSSVPAGGCGVDSEGNPLTCATAPYCRLAQGADCSASGACYSGYTCQDGTCTTTVTASPEITPTPATSPSPTATPTVSASPTVSPAVTPSPIVTPSPEASEDPGIGGQTVATCNESCAVNADCDVNLRCYSGQCRLVTNVSSTTCSNPTDQGLSFSCNEYCANSNECADNLICQNNKCRNPENVNSTTCSSLTSTQQANIVRSCNESCSSNNDCDVNLRCYQGACRLATNPGSYSCSASTKKVVSSSVYGTPKGGSTGTSATEIGKTDPNKMTDEDTTSSGNAMKKVADADTDKMAKGSTGDEEETALDVVKNYFMNNPKLPIILLGAGLGLIIAIILLTLLKKRGDRTPKPPISGGSTIGSKTDKSYEKDLQSKINSLKKGSIQTRVGNNVTTPVKPPQPIPPTISPPLAKMKIPEIKSTPIKNTSGEVFSSQAKTSSMLERLKNKDITPPSV